jgi:hypothetical protein
LWHAWSNATRPHRGGPQCVVCDYTDKRTREDSGLKNGKLGTQPSAIVTPKLAREAAAADDSGGPQYPILPFIGEISYRCFEGCQIYFWRPLKAAYAVPPAKRHLGYIGPPDR